MGDTKPFFAAQCTAHPRSLRGDAG